MGRAGTCLSHPLPVTLRHPPLALVHRKGRNITRGNCTPRPNGNRERGSDGRDVAGASTAVTPADADVFNPAFDVTPAELVTAVVTERGRYRPR